MAESNDSLVTVSVNSSLNKETCDPAAQEDETKQEKGIIHNSNKKYISQNGVGLKFQRCFSHTLVRIYEILCFYY